MRAERCPLLLPGIRSSSRLDRLPILAAEKHGDAHDYHGPGPTQGSDKCESIDEAVGAGANVASPIRDADNAVPKEALPREAPSRCHEPDNNRRGHAEQTKHQDCNDCVPHGGADHLRRCLTNRLLSGGPPTRQAHDGGGEPAR